MPRKLLRVLAVLFALALTATACGADDVVEDAVDAAGDVAEDVKDGAEEMVDDAKEAVEEAMDDEEPMDEEAEDVGGAVDEEAAEEAIEEAASETVEDGGAVTTSIEDLQAEWAATRAALVEEIKAAGYGVTDGVLNGPGGYTVDLNNCPADWSDNAGVVDGVITIGQTIPQSGALAAYGNIGAGMAAYFDYLNANGGIGPDGLQVNYLMKDDEYVATKTQELVAELLEAEDPFFISTLGSPNTFSVRQVLNDACVPQPMSMTGHQAWGDPENFPWTTGQQLSYATEALLWGNWVEQNYEPGTKVAALVMDNDFGLAYEQGFHEFAEASDIIESVEFVRHDPAAATLTNEMTTLAASEPDVFISMTAGNACVLALEEADRSGINDIATAKFAPSVCKAISAYMTPAGDAGDGWLIFGGGFKDNTDPQYANDTYISWMNAEMEAAGLDPNVSLNATGFGQYGWAHGEALRIAVELDGGLTRSNYMIALRALRLNHPGLLEGINFGQNGNEDAYLVEGSDLSRFEYAGDGGADSKWIIEGGVIDLDGQSSNCAWVAGEGC